MIDNILHWNVRWLGSSRRRVKALIKKKDTTICAIAELFLGDNCMMDLGKFLHLNSFLSNLVDGGGKLWVFWKDPNAFQVLFFTSQSITRWFFLDNQKVLITFVYAKCSYIERRELWKEMEERQVNEQPWVVLGVFNAI